MLVQPSKMCQRAIAFLILACALACRTATPPAAPETLVVALESVPAVLDPRFATDAYSERVAELVATGLTRSAASGEPEPDLASEWRQTAPDEYRFTLRPDLRFHDGTPLTAADVAATYRSVADPALRSPKRDAISAVAAIEAPDPRTVVFRLARPSAAFLDSTNLGILPATLTASGPVAPAAVVGAGPFRVAAVYRDGSVDLASHPDYVEGAPSIARVRFRVIPDAVVRALELASGKVDLVENAVEPDMLPWLARQPHLELVVAAGTTFQYLGISFRDRRLADVRVRRALAYGVDRDGIVHHLLRDTARPATGLLPPGHWAYSGDVTTYPYDPERSRALLADAGFRSDELRRYSYKTSTVEMRRRIAEVFQADLAKLDLALDVRSYEWATFYADIRRGNFELYALAWVGVRDPDVYFRIFHSSMQPPAGNNRGGYADRRMDALLEAARVAADREERRRIYAEVQRLAADELPVIPLWWSDNVVVKSRALEGFVTAPDGNLRSLAVARLGDRTR